MPVLSRAVPSFREMYVSLLRLGLEQLHSDWDCGGERSLGGLLSPTLEEGGHTGLYRQPERNTRFKKNCK